MKLFQLLRNGSDRLKEAGILEPDIDAELLWNYISGMDKMQMLLNREQDVDSETESRFMQAIECRCTRKPLQYITGIQNFMGMDFLTAQEVLIPRQDTEVLVEQVLHILKQNVSGRTSQILDLCCGSGCIGLSIKALWDIAEVTLSDISDAAVSLTKKNADKHGLVCDIIQGDLFENITKQYDMIVSNPPYIESHVIDDLMPEVRVFEPRLALDGTADGLYFYRRIIKESEKFLKDEGYILFEIGNNQAFDVQQLLVDANYRDIHVVKDLSGNDRVVYGKKDTP